MKTGPLRKRLDRLEQCHPAAPRPTFEWRFMLPSANGPEPTGEVIFQRFNPETRQVETTHTLAAELREELARRGLPASDFEGADGTRPTNDPDLWPPERRRELARDLTERGLPTWWLDA